MIDTIKTNNISKLFNSDYFVSGKEDASNLFARGFCTIGKDIIDLIKDKIRKLFENSNYIQGLIINNSVSGGTGSGLGCLILEYLNVEYKQTKIGFHIYPQTNNNNISKCIVEPYNTLFATSDFIEHTNESIIFDNKALYNICQRKLNIKKPKYTNLISLKNDPKTHNVFKV